MAGPFSHHNNLPGQSYHGTNSRPSLALGSPISQGIIPNNNHGAADINLALSTATNFPRQHQAYPMSGQLQFRQHGTDPGFRRSNPQFPSDIHMHNMSHYPMRPQNTVNFNIVVGNNSSVNINLLNNNFPSQFAGNSLFASSSSNIYVQNNVIHARTSNFNQYLLPPNQEPLRNSILGINERPQFSTYYSLYSSHRVTFVPNHNQEIPAGIPNFRQVHPPTFRGQASIPGRSIPYQDHIISQSRPDLSLLRLQSRYAPPGFENHAPALPSSTMIPSEEHLLENEGRNDNSTDDEHHTQQSLETRNIQPETEHIDALPQVPLQDDNMTEPQRLLAEANSPNPNFRLNLDARRNRHSTTKCRSHPYIKFGPYTCPKCDLTFEKGSSYAAHVSGHYKGETPEERKKRREGKFKSKDLHIEESSAGITVMPGSPQREDMPLKTSTPIRGMGTRTNQGEGCSYVKIKEEPDTDFTD